MTMHNLWMLLAVGDVLAAVVLVLLIRGRDGYSYSMEATVLGFFVLLSVPLMLISAHAVEATESCQVLSVSHVVTDGSAYNALHTNCARLPDGYVDPSSAIVRGDIRVVYETFPNPFFYGPDTRTNIIRVEQVS